MLSFYEPTPSNGDSSYELEHILLLCHESSHKVCKETEVCYNEGFGFTQIGEEVDENPNKTEGRKVGELSGLCQRSINSIL